jgi:hypothetical protein
MGYYTAHKLVVADQKHYEPISEALYKESGYDDCLFESSYKWYDQDDNCKQVSSQFPNILFAIEGEGEEQGDIWRRTYFGGEMIEYLKPEPFKFPPLPSPPEKPEV